LLAGTDVGLLTLITDEAYCNQLIKINFKLKNLHVGNVQIKEIQIIAIAGKESATCKFWEIHL